MNEARKRKPERMVLFVRRGVGTGYLVLEPDWGSK
jgi:hypothetical protein